MPKQEQKNYIIKKFGPITERRDYSESFSDFEVQDLIAMQKQSFQWFLDHGIEETFRNIYPIESVNGRLTIDYVKNSLRIEKPLNEAELVDLSRVKGSTVSIQIFATLIRKDNETGEIKTQEVLFGEIPIILSSGLFLINGNNKVVVSQLIRSPGAYFELETRKGSDKHLFHRLEIIPKLGIWIKVLHKINTPKSEIKINIDKNNISFSTFLKAFGLTKKNMIDLFGTHEVLLETINRDKTKTRDEALEYIHSLLRKGDRITSESKRNLFVNIFFNKRKYNLLKTGRYLLNKKLNLVDRLDGAILAEDLVSTKGEILYKKGTNIDFELAKEIQRKFDQEILPIEVIPNATTEVYGRQLELNPNLENRNRVIIVKIYPNQQWLDAGKDPIKVIANDPIVDEEHLLLSDFIAAFSYYFNLLDGVGKEDDPDSLVNKRVITIGELLQNQFQIALAKLERVAKEKMSTIDPNKITIKNITNNKIIYNQFKVFFNSSQLVQFMDQVNPLSEMSNKRRLTTLGPGGLSRDTAIVEVRDVHPTHYGRICPIESPEGPNIGLILNFATYSRIDEYGFIQTPYFIVKNGFISDEIVYLTAFQERGKTFAQFSTKIDRKLRKIIADEIVARKDGEYVLAKVDDIDYIEVSSWQMVSISASCIPFLENNDSTRALMGANMQRQAVPIIRPNAPLIATGAESNIAKYSAYNLRSNDDGVITYVDSQFIKVKTNKNRVITYKLRNFESSNQGTIIGQRPLVKMNQEIKKKDLLTDCSSIDKGELALGQNVVVAFSTWQGYGYEDAIIISEKLFKDDDFTSIYIEEQSIQFRTAKIGDDELTSQIPNVSKFAKRNLDENGIVRIGSEVQTGDILVGRVSPKPNDTPTAEEKLMAAIFSQKTKSVRDTSLQVKYGHGGTVVDVVILSRDDGDKLQDGVTMIVKVYIAQKRKIKVGDKMAGRHGNKGVVSKILPIEDMPFLEDGTPVDIILNPQGVPSRMNIGQVLELHLGMAAKMLGTKFVTPPFNGIKFSNINNIMQEAKLPIDGKFWLYDPILEKRFDHKVSVGVMYMLKLNHMVDDKMHSRSIGPYSLITQQPLGGKSQNGGQRFGEMEAWSVESYGASNILQELLTYKSDDIEGRNKLYNAIINGTPLPKFGIPESFSVLAYELRGLNLNLQIELKEEKEEY
ncbi:MAG: DNA-directed RNA polymerase subunit beta [Mycoplasma sp.]|nr:DNA-directed RNA polymerase subunit beta [Mycoplasma sp.]